MPFEPYSPAPLHDSTPSNELQEQVVALTAERNEALAQVCVYRSQADAAYRRIQEVWTDFSTMHDDVQRLKRENETLRGQRDTAQARWAATQ